MILDTMDHHLYHTNYGEMQQLFDTWTRVWTVGGQASLHLHTLEGRALDLDLDQELLICVGRGLDSQVPSTSTVLAAPTTTPPTCSTTTPLPAAPRTCC